MALAKRSLREMDHLLGCGAQCYFSTLWVYRQTVNGVPAQDNGRSGWEGRNQNFMSAKGSAPGMTRLAAWPMVKVPSR